MQSPERRTANAYALRDPALRVEAGTPRFAGVAVVVLVGILVALYWTILRDLVIQWWDDANYSHGFLVPFFSGYLAWQKRDELRGLRPQPRSTGLAIVFCGIAMLILGVVGAENFLARTSLLVIVAGLLLFHHGGPVLRAVAFPLAYLLFMIPLPQIAFNAVAFPLQTLAAENATAALDLLGIPVLRDGNVIHLSRVTLGVTEACSGIRSLVSLLALAVAWGHLSFIGFAPPILLAAAAVPITLVANAGRIVATGLIGQWFGMQYAEGFFHSFSGWVIFLVAFAGLLGVHALLSLAFAPGRRR